MGHVADGIACRMKRLQISNIVAPDLPCDAWMVDVDAADSHIGVSNVCFEIQFDVGPVDADWAEHFFVQIVTPDRRNSRGHRKYLVLHEYSLANLKQYLCAAVSACEMEDWERSLMELRKRFRWEWDLPNG